jgi:uncharacterized oligopeptide transporter (OPT) family protein
LGRGTRPSANDPFLIKGEHGRLPYPEGTACAEVLVANEAGGHSARFVLYGLGLGAFFKMLTSWIRVIPGEVSSALPFIKKGQLAMSLSAALFGVGYMAVCSPGLSLFP